MKSRKCANRPTTAIGLFLTCLIPSAQLHAQAHPRVLFNSVELRKILKNNGAVAEARARTLRRCEKAQLPNSSVTYFLQAMSEQNWDKANKFASPVLRSAYDNALAYYLTKKTKYLLKASDLLWRVAKSFPEMELDWSSTKPNLGSLAIVYDLLASHMGASRSGDVRQLIADACQDSYQEYQKKWKGYTSVLDGSRMDLNSAQKGARLGLAAFAIQGETGYNPDWLGAAQKLVREHVRGGISSDGAFFGEPSDVLFGMDEIGMFILALEKVDVKYMAYPSLRRLPEWLLYEAFPPPYEASYPHRLKQAIGTGFFISMLASRFGGAAQKLVTDVYRIERGVGVEVDPLAKILFPPRGKTSTSLYLSKDRHFNARGLIYFRSGWGPNSVALRVQADPIAHPFAVGAQGSFTLSGYGAHMIVELGHKQKTPLAYNAAFVDGVTQAAQEGSDTEAIVESQISLPFGGYARINLKPSFEYLVSRTGKKRKLVRELYTEMEFAERVLMFIRGKYTPPYVILLDDMQKDKKLHGYDWLLHAPKGTLFEELDNGIRLTEPYGGDYLECPRGSEGGQARFVVDLPREGLFWGWMLVKGSMPFGSVAAGLMGVSDREDRPPHPDVSSWSWRRVPFYRDPRIGHELRGGKHDFILQGNDGAQLARCILSRTKEFVPRAADPDLKDGSIILTPGQAKLRKPWERKKDPNWCGCLGFLFHRSGETHALPRTYAGLHGLSYPSDSH